SFLYILDMKAFPLEVIEATMYKKPYIYTYASHPKNSISKHVMVYFKSDNRSFHIDEPLLKEQPRWPIVGLLFFIS
ncbi:hypothetical protein, partial [Priestia aryabhattai]|uniref:hypothetical protein n=1 Tax=Priestia aryabhattai TaxID=412384 RepID=UPI000AF812D1